MPFLMTSPATFPTTSPTLHDFLKWTSCNDFPDTCCDGFPNDFPNTTLSQQLSNTSPDDFPKYTLDLPIPFLMTSPTTFQSTHLIMPATLGPSPHYTSPDNLRIFFTTTFYLQIPFLMTSPTTFSTTSTILHDYLQYTSHNALPDVSPNDFPNTTAFPESFLVRFQATFISQSLPQRTFHGNIPDLFPSVSRTYFAPEVMHLRIPLHVLTRTHFGREGWEGGITGAFHRPQSFDRSDSLGRLSHCFLYGFPGSLPGDEHSRALAKQSPNPGGRIHGRRRAL